DHLAGEHPETPNVFFLVMEHRHVPVNVDDLASFFLHRDAVVNLGYAGWKYWQLSLRHSALVASSPRNCNRVFRLISFSRKGPIYRARSGGLNLPNLIEKLTTLKLLAVHKNHPIRTVISVTPFSSGL